MFKSCQVQNEPVSWVTSHFAKRKEVRERVDAQFCLRCKESFDSKSSGVPPIVYKHSSVISWAPWISQDYTNPSVLLWYSACRSCTGAEGAEAHGCKRGAENWRAVTHQHRLSPLTGDTLSHSVQVSLNLYLNSEHTKTAWKNPARLTWSTSAARLLCNQPIFTYHSSFYFTSLIYFCRSSLAE